MNLRVAYCLERGTDKAACEDAALAGDVVLDEAWGEVKLTTPAAVFLLDGVGGNPGGRDASLFAARRLASSPPPRNTDELTQLMRDVNRGLLAYAASTADKKTMATTATGVLFTGDGTWMAHIGNTRLYSLRGQYLQQMTEDQTLYQALVRRGLWEEAQTCNRSRIEGALGGGREEYIGSLVVRQVFERGIPATMALTTDGIHEYVDTDSLEELVGSGAPGPEICRTLCRMALENGSTDDRSVLLIRRESSGD